MKSSEYRTMERLEIIKPDDWHLHLRDHDVMRDALSQTVRKFARAVIMPNLKPPVSTFIGMKEYKKRILEALPLDAEFEPLMTIYLTDSFNAASVAGAKEEGVFAIKLYPAGATTNSQEGLSKIENGYSVFEAMEKAGIPLLIHGEVTDPDVDFFDRERIFLERHFLPLVKRFPALKIVLEHLSTKDSVDLVSELPNNVGATITPHHMVLTRNDLFSGGMNPYLFCLPVVKTAEDRHAIIDAAISGNPKFFAGTDSAPHPVRAKISAHAAGGIYNSPVAVEIWTAIFEKYNALDKLETFLSKNGAKFHGLPENSQKLILEKRGRKVEDILPLGSEGAIPFFAGETLAWAVQKS